MKKVLFVGLYNNSLSLLMHLATLKILQEKDIECFITSVGADDYARKDLPYPESVLDICTTELQIHVCRQNPIPPSVLRESMAKNLQTIFHQPKHIGEIIKFIGNFDLIITPYCRVFSTLVGMRDVDLNKVILAPSNGIKPGSGYHEAFKEVQLWLQEHHTLFV